MSPARALPGTLLVVTALVVQTTLLDALPLPGAPPDLLVVVVVALGLAAGPRAGVVAGFWAGLLADLASVHALGRLALAYALVGAAAGRLRGRPEGSVLRPLGVVGAGALTAVLVFAAEGLLLGDERVTAAVVGRSAASSVPYAVVLAPMVVPGVAALVRRALPDLVRR